VSGRGLVVTLQIIASAFIDHSILYFYQRAKTGPKHNDFGSPIPLVVSPRPGAPGYTKSIALLTNRFSASGSEHIRQIFKTLTTVTRRGDTTFGAFGDIINIAQLPSPMVSPAVRSIDCSGKKCVISDAGIRSGLTVR
jgi:C-terminal processing protease CtpA/Prc